MGGVRIANPVLELSQQPAGSQSGTDIAGNISNGILRQTSILFDYQRGKVYIALNQSADLE